VELTGPVSSVRVLHRRRRPAPAAAQAGVALPFYRAATRGPPALSLLEVCRLPAERAPSKRRACCDLLSWQAADAVPYRSRREAAVASWTDDASAVPLLRGGGRAAGI
jgi:hypothetical protein